MSVIFQLSAKFWTLTRSIALGPLSAAEDPEAAVQATESALACLAAAAAHAAVAKLTGWGPPVNLDDYYRELRSVLPVDWLLASTTVPNGAEECFLRVVCELHETDVSLSDYYEGLLEWDWRSGFVRDSDRRRTMGAFHTPQDLANLSLRRLAERMVQREFGDSVDPFGRKALSYLASLSVADMAVGAGRFPVAWLNLFRGGASQFDDRELEELKLRSFGNLELTDVDRPALELSVVACALTVGLSALALLDRPVVRHGNALIDKDPFCQDNDSMLTRGHIWHPSAGVQGPSRSVDVVIGNPPWERVRYEKIQFLRGFDGDVDPLYLPEPLTRFAKERRLATELGVVEMRSDSRLLRSTHGEIYTHVAFTELAMARVKERSGWVCHVVKSTMLNSPGHARFMSELLSKGRVAEVWDFTNASGIFPIDSRERFAVLITSQRWEDDPQIVFGLTEVGDLNDPSKLTRFPAEIRRKLSPELGLLPACSGADLDVLVTLSRFPTFEVVYPKANFGRLLHLTNHAKFIHRNQSNGSIPVWEGRMIEQFTSKFSTWAGVHDTKRWNAKTRAQLVGEVDRANRGYIPECRWWVDQSKWREVSARHGQAYSLGWRNASAPTNRRTVLATILRSKPTTQSIQLLQLPSSSDLLLVLGIMNSLPFDWLVRRRMAGIDVTSTVIRGTPVPEAARWEEEITFNGETLRARYHVNAIVARLLSENSENDDLLREAGQVIATPPDVQARWRLQRQLDVLVSWAYGRGLAGLQEFAVSFPKEISDRELERIIQGAYGNLDDQL